MNHGIYATFVKDFCEKMDTSKMSFDDIHKWHLFYFIGAILIEKSILGKKDRSVVIKSLKDSSGKKASLISLDGSKTIVFLANEERYIVEDIIKCVIDEYAAIGIFSVIDTDNKSKYGLSVKIIV